MSAFAPLRVPVEIRRPGGGRWFRMAEWVSVEEVQLLAPLPEEVDGPVDLRFVLPPVAERLSAPVSAVARVGELRFGEGAEEHVERRALLLHTIGERDRSAIAGYVEERLRQP